MLKIYLRERHKSNDLNGAVEIPIILKIEEKLMSKKPIFIYKTYGDGISDAFYLNYNPKYEKKDIMNSISNGKSNQLKAVIKIEVHYD